MIAKEVYKFILSYTVHLGFQAWSGAQWLRTCFAILLYISLGKDFFHVAQFLWQVSCSEIFIRVEILVCSFENFDLSLSVLPRTIFHEGT